MKHFNKIVLIIAAAVCGVITASAQMRTAYFMEGSYFRTDMNAALAPTRGYVKIPVAGGIGVDFGNNYLSVNNLLYKRNDGIYTFMHHSVSADEFLGKLGNKGKISANLNTSLIGFGAHTKKFFWSFGLNLRSNTELTLSKDMFVALKNLSNGYYNLGDTHLSNREYIEGAIGFAIPLKEFMTFGFRVKGLVGLADLSMKMDQMYLDVNENSVKAELLGNIRGNCPVFKPNYVVGDPFSVEGIMQQDILGALKGIKSYGFGLDLGFEFRFLNDQLKVSVAANDIGFIKWYGHSTVNAQGNANFTYNGFNLSTGDADLAYGFEAKMTEPQGEYFTRLTCSLNAGIEYNILNNWIAFGLLSHTQFCQNFTRTELTASANFRIMHWLSTSISHTFLNGNQPGVLGWALNFHPAGFNLFIGADFIDTRFAVYNTANKSIPIPKMMTSANVYVGLGINLGKAKYMPAIQGKKLTYKQYKLKKEAEKKAAEQKAAEQQPAAAKVEI
ncbi:MAG: hypothetical protein IKL20_01305 [Alistipes sp.]|nr:hypothetical protein [Alistipes sp.]